MKQSGAAWPRSPSRWLPTGTCLAHAPLYTPPSLRLLAAPPRFAYTRALVLPLLYLSPWTFRYVVGTYNERATEAAATLRVCRYTGIIPRLSRQFLQIYQDLLILHWPKTQFYFRSEIENALGTYGRIVTKIFSCLQVSHRDTHVSFFIFVSSFFFLNSDAFARVLLQFLRCPVRVSLEMIDDIDIYVNMRRTYVKIHRK